ncbi:MAG: hypothetical protein H3C31_07080 [Brumimicrobium sp.]|nr:hypothetical protein [Brumimicrobium sp.]
MKTKKLIVGIFSTIMMAVNVNAADLCVSESGSGGCYSSISDAIAAAADGDRILIQPKTGGASYTENFIINKSVQLLSNTEGVMWVMTGNITVTPAIGRKISILHMKNNTGYIAATGASPAGARCEVNIMNCELLGGYINFNYDYFNANIISNIINKGYIAIRFGNVIGNEIKNTTAGQGLSNGSGYYLSCITVNTDGLVSNDTLNIVGNMMTIDAGNYPNFIYWNNSSQFFNIMNNYGYNSSSPSNYDTYYLTIAAAKNSALTTNKIINNTIYTRMYYANRARGIYFPFNNSSYPNSKFDVLNNLLLGDVSSTVMISDNTGTNTISCSYNYLNNGSVIYGITDDGTNNANSNTTINTTTGKMNIGSDGFNAGYPDFTYYDIDLTQNDVGCYGGSFTLDNFFPITGAARVFFVNAPRTILQSGTLNIKANSFDR